MKLYAALAAGYVALVVLANWLASKYLITVPLTHYIAPAGVLCVGAVLVLRDWLWQIRETITGGPRWLPKSGFWSSLAVIVVAGIASFVLAFAVGYSTPPGATLMRVSVASLVAFLVSEGIFESILFAPLRRRRLTLAVGLSATVGNAVDSLVFLAIAFPAIWTTLYAGNFVGKLEMIFVGVVLTAGRRFFLPTSSAVAQA